MGTNGAVLIVTTDPLRNPNYGGILQAWALCEALKKLGYTPWIYDRRSTRLWRVWYSVVRLVCRFAPRRLTRRWWHCWPENQPILEFARSNLRYTSSTVYAPCADAAVRTPFIAYLTGSDQVWRPDYYDVPEKLLAFVPADFPGPRFSYAASFGKDDLAIFNGRTRDITRPLAQRLTAISVREQSGVLMAKKLWGVDAQRVTDPVFLIEPGEYRKRFDIPAEGSTLVTYILDPNEEADSAVAELRNNAGLGISDVVDLSPRGKNAQKPTVEEWIRTIGSAKYVVTDSFHGTAFALLLGRPFITFPNQSRGATRFDSLFEIYERHPTADLHNEQLEPGDRLPTLSAERETGIAYLENALERSPSPSKPPTH